MKYLRKVGDWFKILFNKVDSNVSKIGKLELEAEKIRESKINVEEAYDRAKGNLITYEKELKLAIGRKNDLINLGKQLAQKPDTSDDTFKKLQDKVIGVDSEITNIETQISISKNIIAKLDSQYEEIKKKSVEYTNKTKELKMKDAFAKDIKEFSSVIGDDSLKSNFDEIARDIEVSYNTSNMKAERVESASKDEIESLLKGNDLDSFKKMLTQ